MKHYYLTLIVGVIANTIARLDFYLANKFFTLRNKAIEAIDSAVETVVAETDNALLFATEARDHELNKVHDQYSRALQSVHASHIKANADALSARTAKLNNLKTKKEKLHG